MTEHVIIIDEGPIRLVRMNRLEKMNAITDDMYDKLAGALEDAAHNKAIHCVVITGGTKVFSAGSDLNDFLHAAQHMEGLRPAVGRFLRGLVHTEKPVVAGVQGVAIGIGMTMLLHFDYVVAATNARFSAPFAELGVVPEAGSSLLVPRLMGVRRAFALLVMGRPLDAEQAKAVGLVNIVVPPEQVEEEVMKAAREIAALPVQAVAASRRLIHGSPAEIMKRTIEEADIFRARLRSPEARAAFERFFNRKR
jgi:enoyl-CoA hydratase/carnithine racemase